MMHFVVSRTETKTTESMPVIVDRKRMDQALAAKRVTMPQGLSREEMRQHILATAREK